MEKDIDENYLIQLNDAYTHFYHTETPLLIVNTSTINLPKMRETMKILSGIYLPKISGITIIQHYKLN